MRNIQEPEHEQEPEHFQEPEDEEAEQIMVPLPVVQTTPEEELAKAEHIFLKFQSKQVYARCMLNNT